MIYIFNLIRFLIGFLLLILMISFSVNKMSKQYCDITDINISIDENKFVTKDEIKRYLDRHELNPDNTRVNNISFNDIEQILISHPSVKEAVVYSDVFGNININVTQRKPIVRVQNNKEAYYIDEEGDKMDWSPIYTARMLLITGDINSVKEIDLFSLSSYIYYNQLLKKQIVQIDILDSKLTMLTRVGEIIEFGRITDIEEKFGKLMTYYDQGNNHNKEYKIINLEYNNQIVCKK